MWQKSESLRSSGVVQLETKYFGIIEYDAEAVIRFAEPMLGFHDLTRFLLLPGDAPNDLFYWLQSIEDGEIAFVLLDVYQVLPEYNPLVEPEVLESLGQLEGNVLEIYNIAVVPEDFKQIRVNLKAPIVINPNTRLGLQVVVNNEEYGVRHYIFDEIDRQSVTGR